MDDKDFSYRKLIVWQKAMALSGMVYALVRKFPGEEKYALSDQVRRAVVSIASNIAEGCGRTSNRDYAHFLSIARGSLWQRAMELVKAVYALSKAFPADERYALTDQLRRAVTSIPSNIAEGSGRASNADYGHFLSIARGSLYRKVFEVVGCVAHGL